MLQYLERERDTGDRVRGKRERDRDEERTETLKTEGRKFIPVSRGRVSVYGRCIHSLWPPAAASVSICGVLFKSALD